MDLGVYTGEKFSVGGDMGLHLKTPGLDRAGNLAKTHRVGEEIEIPKSNRTMRISTLRISQGVKANRKPGSGMHQDVESAQGETIDYQWEMYASINTA